MESALLIFAQLAGYVMSVLLQYLGTLHGVLGTCLQHESMDVRVAALRAACAFINVRRGGKEGRRGGGHQREGAGHGGKEHGGPGGAAAAARSGWDFTRRGHRGGGLNAGQEGQPGVSVSLGIP